ncbi:MAG: XRE family transcriptional regulator, partial [Pseudomonadota bacterium]
MVTTELATERKPDSGEFASQVGADLRHLRKLRGLTLIVLAERINRSVGWLSQIERGLTEPGIAELRTIARELDAPVSFFFRNDDTPSEEQGLVVRMAARTSIGSDAEGLREELLSPDLGGGFEMIRSVFAPGAKGGIDEVRPTEEGGYVVSGTLDL